MLPLSVTFSENKYSVYECSQEMARSFIPRATHFFVLIQTQDSCCTIITESEDSLESIRAEHDWVRLSIGGEIPFTASGVLASILDPLARKTISFLVISSFATDHIFLKSADLDEAQETLREAGIQVRKEISALNNR